MPAGEAVALGLRDARLPGAVFQRLQSVTGMVTLARGVQAPDQCALPNAETAAMLFWALMASGQITMRRVDGWQTLDQAPVEPPLDLAA